MRTLELAVKDTIGRRRRFIVSVASLAIGIAIFMGTNLLSKAFEERTRDELTRLGANIVVLPEAVADPGSGEHPTFPQGYTDRIRHTPNAHMLRAVSPKLATSASIGERSLAVEGITADEAQMKLWWRVGGRLASRSMPRDGEILLGSELGSALDGKHSIQLLGRAFKLSGVLDPTGSADDRKAFVSLATLQEILGKPRRVDSIGISTACISCPTMTVFDHAREIAEALPADVRVVPVKQIAESQVATLRQVKRISGALALLVLCFATALILSQLYASVAEQQREIGILVSLGMTPRQLWRHFALRGVLIGVPGGVLGLAGGSVLGVALGPSIAGFIPLPSWYWLPSAIAVGGGLSAVASLPAAARAVAVEPGRIMRKGS